MGDQKHLAEESIGKLLMKYSIPAIIGMMVNALYNIVDRMFIGRIPEVGSLALTGVGITTVFVGTGSLFFIGLQPIMSYVPPKFVVICLSWISFLCFTCQFK